MNPQLRAPVSRPAAPGQTQPDGGQTPSDPRPPEHPVHEGPTSSTPFFGTIAGRVLSLSVGEILINALSFLALAYLARVLGPGGFGVIAFAASVVAFLNILHEGLNTFGAREIARDPSLLSRCTHDLLTLKLVLSLAMYGALGLLVYAVPQPLQVKYVLLGYGLTLFTAAFSPRWVFLGQQRFHLSALQGVLQQVTYVVGVFLFVTADSHLARVPAVQVVAEAIAVGVFFALLTRSVGTIRWTGDVSAWKSICRQSLPISAFSALMAVNYFADIVMLGLLASSASVGLYSAAYRIPLFILTLVSLYHLSIFPTLARYYDQGIRDAAELVSSSVRLSAMAAIPIAVGGSMLASPILTLVYGPEYVTATTAFRLLLWSAAIMITRTNYKIFLVAFHRQQQYLKAASYAAGANVALNLALIPRFGMVGAASATLVSEGLFLLLAHAAVSRSAARIPLIAPLLKPSIAAVVMALGMYLLGGEGTRPLVPFLGGAVTYALVLGALRPLSRHQLEVLRRA